MKPIIQAGTVLALIVSALVLLLLAAAKIAPLLLLFVIALVLTAGIDPMVAWLSAQSVRGWRMPRILSTLVVLVAILTGILGVLSIFVVTAVHEGIAFYADWPTYHATIDTWLRDLNSRWPMLPAPSSLLDTLSAQSAQIAGYLWTTTRALFSLVGAFFSILFLLILTFFFTACKPQMVYLLAQFVPPALQPRVLAIGHQAAEKAGRWVRGQCTLAVIITLITAATMSAFRVKYAIIIAIIAGIGEMIPMVGPYVGAVPAVLVLLLTGHSWLHILLVLLFFGVLAQVENYYLAPKVMEREVGLAPVTSIVALLVGGALLGLVGAVLAIPLAAAGRVILLEAVFPWIQGKTRAEIEAGLPGPPPPPAGPIIITDTVPAAPPRRKRRRTTPAT